ncbi:MAG: thioredoxin family protein [Candidatus Omnitrophica bacterium CG11_big_fil_rev_8_21_14_0_20_63_9]|nr:MAG: thioredoxin family protein [Candidatus Omnitrophica bacterium CG11_big_fil_rev_8_21_14_0_20_63_9]
MKTSWLVGGLVACGLIAGAASAEPQVGQPAPDFTSVDVDGAPQALSAYRGRYVVLEWFNPECPFVKKHYGSGNMQQLQQELTKTPGVAWLSFNSSAPGKQGHLSPEQAKAWKAQQGASMTAMLLDPDGAIGRLYGAKTTPHMFIIDPEGVLVYAGAIDDTPSADQADVKTATNYVRQALGEAVAGKPISASKTPSYGCSVKY